MSQQQRTGALVVALTMFVFGVAGCDGGGDSANGLGPRSPDEPHGWYRVPGGPSGSVRVHNPCDGPVDIRVYLVPVEQQPTGTAVSRTVKPGGSPSVVGYEYQSERGPHDIVVTVAATGWSYRTPAVTDGTEMLIEVDADACE